MSLHKKIASSLTLIIILCFFLLSSPDSSANFVASFQDFAPDRANQIFTDVTGFPDPLSASDVTIQQALETLNARSCKVETDCSTSVTEGRCCWDSDDDTLYYGDGTSAKVVGPDTVTVITECETTDDYCFTYVGSILRLFVNGNQQAQWPEIGVTEFLLLDNDSDVLLIDSSNKLLIVQ